MPTSCITGSVCSAAPLWSQLWIAWGQSVLPAPLPWFWAPAERWSVPGWCQGVTAHAAVLATSARGQCGAAELWEQPALLGSCSWPPKREGLDQGAAPGGMLLA